MFRAAVARNARLFSSSVRVAEKGPVEAAGDALKTVDKNVSQTIVKVKHQATKHVRVDGIR